MPAAVMTTCLETGPEQFAITPSPASAKPLTAIQRNRPRPLEVTQCSMCGIALPLGLLVPDGGPACADIRWYCKDAMSCTERWTTARPPGRAQTPTASDDAFAGAAEAVPDRASAERLGSMFEAAQSAGLPTSSQVRRGSPGTHLRTPGHEVCGTLGSARSIFPAAVFVCHDLGSHRIGEPLLTSGAWSRQIQRVRLVEVHNVRMSTPQDRADTPTRPKCV
jgi:hypothetical protein